MHESWGGQDWQADPKERKQPTCEERKQHKINSEFLNPKICSCVAVGERDAKKRMWVETGCLQLRSMTAPRTVCQKDSSVYRLPMSNLRHSKGAEVFFLSFLLKQYRMKQPEHSDNFQHHLPVLDSPSLPKLYNSQRETFFRNSKISIEFPIKSDSDYCMWSQARAERDGWSALDKQDQG